MTPDDGVGAFDDAALATVARLRSRFRGALLGLALGDALAAPAQYARAGSFPPVRDLLGGGPYDLPVGAWTDDTALALLLARSLLSSQGCNANDQLEGYRRWQRRGEGSATGECLGITASVSRALVDGRPAKDLSDGADALVRVAPLAMWHYSAIDALFDDLPAMVGVTSHAPETLAATREFATLMHRALRGLPPAISSAITPASTGPTAAERALITARDAVAGAQNWKDAVLAAINAGGDADVHGAAAGQLAGALFGIESIPARWLATLYEREQIESLADALLTEVLVKLGDST
ncbi:MAG: ADP-ribosylglycohydrolase family protein [Gammaproteobacteria bacterium]